MGSRKENADAPSAEERRAQKAAKKAEKQAKKEAKKLAKAKAREADAARVIEEPKPSSETANSDEAAPKEKSEKKEKKRSEWGVWIGNLPFSTTKEDIAEFFKPCGGTITRVNLPKKNGKISGFAYVDFDSESPMNLALAYSEQKIGGRAVLIKNANDFTKTGMPSRVAPKIKEAEKAGEGDDDKSAGRDKKAPKRSKNDPSPTLFVGNLGFNTTKAALKAIFRPFGDIAGVRIATFEDNPEKCKGFAYIDFVYTDDATRAMASPDTKNIGGRRTRIEYAGELATRKGRPWEFDSHTAPPNPKKRPFKSDGQDGKGGADENESHPDDGGVHSDRRSADRGPRADKSKSRKLNTDNMAETKLQGLTVEFEGKKITFGD